MQGDDRLESALLEETPISEATAANGEFEIFKLHLKSKGRYCEFCEQEFSSLDDFWTHMKRYGFICDNGTDYFSDMPWYPKIEVCLKFVKYG